MKSMKENHYFLYYSKVFLICFILIIILSCFPLIKVEYVYIYSTDEIYLENDIISYSILNFIYSNGYEFVSIDIESDFVMFGYFFSIFYNIGFLIHYMNVVIKKKKITSKGAIVIVIIDILLALAYYSAELECSYRKVAGSIFFYFEYVSNLQVTSILIALLYIIMAIMNLILIIKFPTETTKNHKTSYDDYNLEDIREAYARIKGMRDKGLINDDEFEEMKKNLNETYRKLYDFDNKEDK